MRRTGKTTRILDRCIQYLFTKGIVYLYEGRNDKLDVSKEIFDRFVARMSLEHPDIEFYWAISNKDGINSYKIELRDGPK